jgi:hypothetical protein
VVKKMARQIPRTELDAILEIVGRFPNGAPFEDIAKRIAPTLPRRTLQRRLAHLVEKKQLILEGRARGSLYRLAEIGQEPPLVSEDYIPISTESEAIKRSVREPVQKRDPIGENLEWLPRMDSNHDKVIQSHLCYRYTTRQSGTVGELIMLFASVGTYKNFLETRMVELNQSPVPPRAEWALAFQQSRVIRLQGCGKFPSCARGRLTPKKPT